MKIKEVIKEHFFINPSERLRVRELERKLRLPLPSVIRYCKELEQEKMLKTITIGKTRFYTANRASEEFILEKKLFNIKQLYLQGLVKHLKEEIHNPVIIVFGSYAKGEDIEDSDIDIYIETKSNKKLSLEKYEKALKRKIQLFTHKSIKEVKNKHLANNIINGLTLNNQLEVF